MQQIQVDPNKSALIAAVTAGLGDNPDLAMSAVCKLSVILPVYLAPVADLETAAKAFIAYLRDGGPIPDWYKHAAGL